MADQTEYRTVADVLGDLMTGLQVPLSMGGILGAASAPTRELRTILGLDGWHGRDEARAAVERFLGDVAHTQVDPEMTARARAMG